MDVKYLGPRDSVNVGGYGKHHRGEIKAYPAALADDLVKSSRRQKFEAVKPKKAKPRYGAKKTARKST